MRISQMLALILVCLLALTSTVDAQTDTPEQVARDYIASLFSEDQEDTAGFIYAADQEIFSEQEALSIVEYEDTSILSADLTALEYEAVDEGEDWAHIRVTGELSIMLKGAISAKAISPSELRLSDIWMIREEEAWNVCLRPPAAALRELSPEGITQVFYEAAYGLDYETAHAVICETRSEVFNEVEFERIFGVLEAQDLRVDLSEVTYTIAEQTDEAATVEVGGILNLYEAKRPSPFRIPASQMNLGPVQLVLEDGWKVCSSVES